jgi:hypothetical protein
MNKNSENEPQAANDDDDRPTRAPEDELGEPGAEGGSHSDASDKLPAAPADDDSELGDTDQHSNA